MFFGIDMVLEFKCFWNLSVQFFVSRWVMRVYFKETWNTSTITSTIASPAPHCTIYYNYTSPSLYHLL